MWLTLALCVFVAIAGSPAHSLYFPNRSSTGRGYGFSHVDTYHPGFLFFPPLLPRFGALTTLLIQAGSATCMLLILRVVEDRASFFLAVCLMHSL